VGLYKTPENFNYNRSFKMKFLRKLCTLTIKLGAKLHLDKLIHICRPCRLLFPPMSAYKTLISV
jgi:hypothetical protein